MKKKTLFGLLGVTLVAGIVAYAVKKFKEVDDFDFDDEDFGDDFADWEDADIAAEFDNEDEFFDESKSDEKPAEEVKEEQINADDIHGLGEGMDNEAFKKVCQVSRDDAIMTILAGSDEYEEEYLYALPNNALSEIYFRIISAN